MNSIKFYPLGNADCCQIILDNGRRVLFDYAATKDFDDSYDKRCDLLQELREDLDNANQDSFDVVVFTHLDKDHYQGSSEFFLFDHNSEFQGDDRIKIETMWVPAAIILETEVEDDEAQIIQKEAQYRFKNGYGIRVFSRPERIEEWCQNNNIPLESRRHLVVDAGNLVPDFDLENDEVEFFVHSPFAKRVDDDTVVDRNDSSIVVQATFVKNGIKTKVLLMADVTHDVLADIIQVTQWKDREERLEFDIVKLPHHCSYLSLGPEKGVDKTTPDPTVALLYENQAQKKSYIVSTSKPIPDKGIEEDRDNNPPHRQAANYYKEAVGKYNGMFKVTMEHPNVSNPEPMVFEIGTTKVIPRHARISIGAPAISSRPPRAG